MAYPIGETEPAVAVTSPILTQSRKGAEETAKSEHLILEPVPAPIRPQASWLPGFLSGVNLRVDPNTLRNPGTQDRVAATDYEELVFERIR